MRRSEDQANGLRRAGKARDAWRNADAARTPPRQPRTRLTADAPGPVAARVTMAPCPAPTSRPGSSHAPKLDRRLVPASPTTWAPQATWLYETAQPAGPTSAPLAATEAMLLRERWRDATWDDSALDRRHHCGGHTCPSEADLIGVCFSPCSGKRLLRRLGSDPVQPRHSIYVVKLVLTQARP